MLTSLIKTVSAAALSMALALGAMTATATPARADGTDAARLFAGLLALYGISRVIDMNNDRRENASRNQHVPTPEIVHPGPRGHDVPSWHQNYRIAPESCRIEFNTHEGLFRGYRARCMQDTVARPGLLPPECIRQFETTRGTRNYYGGRCLSQNGWVREAGFGH